MRYWAWYGSTDSPLLAAIGWAFFLTVIAVLAIFLFGPGDDWDRDVRPIAPPPDPDAVDPPAPHQARPKHEPEISQRLRELAL